jgi:hypothetical protein
MAKWDPLPELPAVNWRDSHAQTIYTLLKRSRTALLWAQAENRTEKAAHHRAQVERLTRLILARNQKYGVQPS